MPTGLGGGSPFDPSSLERRDLPESISADSEFTYLVTFTQPGHLLNLLKDRDTTGPNSRTFLSDPARMR